MALKQIANIYVIRVLEGEEKESKIEKVLKGIMSENFPNLMRQPYRFKKLSES